MFAQIRKRDGRVVEFDASKITEAIFKAAKSVGGTDKSLAESLAQKVIARAEQEIQGIPTVEQLQDIVEKILIEEGHAKTAKAYILYRNERAKVREKQKQVPEHVRKLVAESKKYFRNPLSEFIYFRTYSRWIEEEGRRETWIETVDRYMAFMKENLGRRLTEAEYAEVREGILKQEAMPSMRLLWSAGKAARSSNVTAYNCSFIAPTKLEDFAEIMYLSMCGAGVGFSVESEVVQQLPIIRRQTGAKLSVHAVQDSKEGWGNALTLGLKTWFDGKDIAFDFSRLRPAGARLNTMGGRSSGPGVLRDLLAFARTKILSRQGKRLRNIDVHDVICKIGEVVVMGGVRRTALISLSDLDDEEMRHAKTGQFYLTEPQRSMANNSAVYLEKPSATTFLDEWLALAKSGTGERGIFNRGGLRHQLPERRWKLMGPHAATTGTNPCVTGETLVPVADGRGNVPIRDLAARGRDVPVFTLNGRGKVTVRMMRNPRLTEKNAPIYKVTLDDGSAVRATANHKFRLKSGEYKQVDELIPGDSLALLTRYRASIKDIFPDANSRSQDYWWLTTGAATNAAEHRLIAAFHQNVAVPTGMVVHHKDRNALNNSPENLEILTKEAHDALHANLMLGDANPMRRAHEEWSSDQWAAYRQKHSANNAGASNKRFSGFTDEQLRSHALALTKALGHRFSQKDWAAYAKAHGLPQSFSKWRRDHLGGILGLAKWAALELGYEHVDADPRVLESFKKYASLGYDCDIREGELIIHKRCEVCGSPFDADKARREYGVCSISCGLKRAWSAPGATAALSRRLREAHAARKAGIREAQTKIYSDLKFQLSREPTKKEWAAACRAQKLSAEIARDSSPFRAYGDLQEAAATYNHKVASVEFTGYEDVYNGTVDEFHNFFVGGLASQTRNGKPKLAYLNNLQCGEIILRSKSFCNLSEVVARKEDTEASLLRKVRLATIIGTYQSMLTNFPYLSREWKENCEEERLLGVSLTGQWDSPAARNPETLRKMRQVAITTNQNYSSRFGINESTCISCIKPSGTVSQLTDSSSGMHPRHAKFYIRRVRISATDPFFQMLKEQKFPCVPEVGQSEASAATWVLEFPVKAPEGAVLKNDLTALDQLVHWKLVKENFTEHNPSVTVSVGEKEWIATAHWLYENWDILGGLSFLPRSDHVYQLAPYEEISEERYNELVAALPKVDFANIVLYEKEDQTIGAKEVACAGGACEIAPGEGQPEKPVAAATK